MKWISNSSTQEDLINRFRDTPLEFEPGQEYRYSNSGYVLLGALIQQVTGQPYEVYFQEHLFNPAGMYDTCIEEPSEIIKDRTLGYQLDENGQLQNAPYVHMSNAHAAGAILSTVRDLHKWDQALDSNILIKESTKQRMWTPSKETTDLSYGYGWVVQETPYGKLVGHSGGVYGFSSIFLKYVDSNVTVIVLNNTTQPVDTIAREIAAIVIGDEIGI